MPNEVKLLPCEFRIEVCWDADASVWWVKSCNVPGLNLEDDDPWKLIKRAVECAPELLELNNLSRPTTVVTDEVVERVARALFEHAERRTIAASPELSADPSMWLTWDSANEPTREPYREAARAAIEAMPTVVTGEQPLQSVGASADADRDTHERSQSPLSPPTVGIPSAVVVPGELYAFLMGEGPLQDTWFDDLNKRLPGKYWWRALLRCAEGVDEVQKRLREGLRAFPRDAARILSEMGDGEYCKTGPTIAEETGLPLKRVQEIHRALRTLGFASFGTLQCEDDGSPIGSGYWATRSGELLASAIEASGQDGETRLDAKHESAIGSEASETPKGWESQQLTTPTPSSAQPGDA